MGFDVTYHPVSEQEMNDWYFEPLEWMRAGHIDKIQHLAADNGIEDVYLEKYLETLRVGAQTGDDELFDKSHSYYMAVVQGFFRTYYYTRGAAYTFLVENKPAYSAYTKPWQAIWRKPWANKAYSRLVENYCGGVYLPPEQVNRLLDDYAHNKAVQQDLDEAFSHGRLAVFLKALQAAQQNGLGLLEAAEVVEPNPFNPNASPCYSNLYHCDTDGVLLYIDAAAAQLAEAMQNQSS